MLNISKHLTPFLSLIMSASGWERITKRYCGLVFVRMLTEFSFSPSNVGTYPVGRGSDKERREGAAAAAAAAQRPAVWDTKGC